MEQLLWMTIGKDGGSHSGKDASNCFPGFFSDSEIALILVSVHTPRPMSPKETCEDRLVVLY